MPTKKDNWNRRIEKVSRYDVTYSYEIIIIISIITSHRMKDTVMKL